MRDGSRIQASLRTVSRIWGGDKVQHYRWAERGESYCTKLCVAARAVRHWDEAVMKLNKLIHRRDQQVGRRHVRMGVNPIEPVDLIDLRAWSHTDAYTRTNDEGETALSFRQLTITDMLDGFSFDSFGLLIRMEERPLGSVPERGANGPREISDPGEQGQIQQPKGSRKRQTPLENEQRRTKRVRTAV
ncbi:hypothetical protein V8F06_011101, partial [Rhypophila decipiens]